MEYKGIITGIGDKETKTNLIQPEYDALINDFIIGKDTILEGLELSGNNLSAGTCILCGYRGIIDRNITVDYTNYVYGLFSISFGREGRQDEFNIVSTPEPLTSYPVNPTQITESGTYALLLYENGVKSPYLDTEHPYPVNSQYSAETEKVLDYAEIAETVTTPTDINELDEVITDLHETQPNRVVNTEYVQAQIEKEIDYDYAEAPIRILGDKGTATTGGTVKFYRKARYVIGELTYEGAIGLQGFELIQKLWVDIPEGFIPLENKQGIVTEGGGGYVYYIKFWFTAGSKEITIERSYEALDISGGQVFQFPTTSFGYQCQ